jgi:hypothetical protein
MAPNGATTTPNISSTSVSRSANGSGITGSGGTTNGGGVRASISTWGPLHVFNLVVKFFRELQQNYYGVNIEKLKNLQDFQRKPHKSLSLCMDAIDLFNLKSLY